MHNKVPLAYNGVRSVSRCRKIIILIILGPMLGIIAWAAFPCLDGKYNAHIFHCMCDSEQYVELKDGVARLVRFHPDRAEKVVFEYERLGLYSVNIKMIGMVDYELPSQMTLSLYSWGLQAPDGVFDKLSVESNMNMFLWKYWITGN